MDEKEFGIALAQAKAELIEADKAIIKEYPNPADRVEALKTIFNRARDICKDNHRQNNHENIEKQKKEPDLSKFDKPSKTWMCCPICDSKDIIKESQKGRKFQGCYDCGIFLNRDGTIKEIEDKK
jgi:hypothetical protein